MLLHQFIVVVMATARRFESVLLGLVVSFRRLISRDKIGGSDLQET